MMVCDMVGLLDIKDDVVLSKSVPYNFLPEQIMASDCVVVPSLSEGFGFSAVEACAMGKPVVVSNVASLPEVVSGQYVLVEAKNPKAIAKGVVQVFDAGPWLIKLMFQVIVAYSVTAVMAYDEIAFGCPKQFPLGPAF